MRKPIKGYIPKEKAPKPPLNLGEELFVANNLQAYLARFKKNVESILNEKTEEVEGVIEEANKNYKENTSKLDQKLLEFEESATQILQGIHNIATIKGRDGKDADEEKIVENVVSKLPSKEEIIKKLPKIDEDALAKRVIEKIPQNKASLKVIQEKFETDPMSVIDKILAMPEGKFKLKSSHIEGLEQTISAFRNQIATKGYLHGGGDTVAAGTNITITKNSAGEKVIASTGGGSPGGSTTQVQYNNSGSFGGITGATTDGSALTLVAPVLGTPASATLTNATGLPISTGVSGLGTNVATALAVNVGSAGAFLTFNGDAGTPSALIGTNITGTASGLTAGNVTTNANLTGQVTSVGNAAVLGSFTSAQLASALTNETGSGSAVFSASPTFTGTVGAAAITATGAIQGTVLTATAASSLVLGTASSTTGGMILKNATNANNVIINSGVTSTSYTLTLPLAVAGAGEVLTDAAGDGVLSWASSGAGANTALSNLSSVAINTALVSDTYNTDALGTSAIAWSDLFLGTGSVIDFSSASSTSDVTITHSSGALTLAGGDLFIANGDGMVIGHDSQITANNTAEFQVLGTGGPDAAILIGKWQANNKAPVLSFIKSRNATIGSHTIVQDNDKVGVLNFMADDGVDFATQVAQFITEVDDASPSAGDIGTAFAWSQMPGGAGALTETMRLTASGSLQIVGLTASEIVITDASKGLTSAAVATYPSLTELAYVKGVTSAIQTQIDSKGAAPSGTINEIAYFDSSSSIASLAVATYPSLTELAYVKGATSAIQTQMDLKAPLASPTFTGTVNSGDIIVGTGAGVVIGYSSQVTGRNTSEFQLLGTTGPSSTMLIGRWSADNKQTNIHFIKSRNATIGSHTIVQDNDNLGELAWLPDDGVDFATRAARFIVEVDDASPAAQDIGTAFVWQQMPGGEGVDSGVAAETMRITAAGSVQIANLTASEIVITDGSKGLTSAAVATYPSLTELSYVKGVTSALQTQLGTKLALTGGTMSGDITLGENTSIALDPAGSADGKYSGITITGTGGATLAFGDLIYLQASDSRWELVDADAVATGGDLLIGMCVLASTDGAALTILLQGTIRADANFPALTIGSAVYASTDPGNIQVADPTGTDDFVRVVGFALTADEIYFNPSQDHATVV